MPATKLVVAYLLKQMKFSWPAWLGIKEFVALAAVGVFERGVWMIYHPAAYLVGGLIVFAAAWFSTAPQRPQRPH